MLSADFDYNPDPIYPLLIPFKLANAAVINNPSYSCAASTLSSNLTIHIPDVLFPDGNTRIWMEMEYDSALSVGGNVYFLVTGYGYNS